MKKAIVIASAVISLLYSIFCIIIIVKDASRLYNPIYYKMIISMVTLIMSMGIPILLLAFISVLVIFNRKLSKVFRILFVIISIIFLMLSIIVFGDILFCLIIRKIPIYYLSVINIVSQTAITITMLTYIRRALWPAPK